MTPRLRVVRAGALLTCQDLGRPGLGHLGVARSGAADRGALRLANRIVGNVEGAAGLEVLAGHATFAAEGELVVAVTGARCRVTLDGAAQARHAALRMGAGAELRLDTVTSGLRAYVSVRGGIDVEPVLGSRSYDQLGDLGPAPLADGDVVPIGHEAAGPAFLDAAPVHEDEGVAVLHVLAGPRHDWIDGALDALCRRAWTVSPTLDRTGVRLEGEPLRRRAEELASEGMLPGFVQVPPDGRPIVLGPDAGVTGGYPVVAVVVDRDLDRVGQLAPGAAVQFVPAR